jgi:hypothetical protein
LESTSEFVKTFNENKKKQEKKKKRQGHNHPEKSLPNKQH